MTLFGLRRFSDQAAPPKTALHTGAFNRSTLCGDMPPNANGVALSSQGSTRSVVPWDPAPFAFPTLTGLNQSSTESIDATPSEL